MGNLAPGIHSGRLAPQEYDANFSDLHPAFDRHEALVAADRCYFCYDAPCMTACPTSIDIPMFIREISTSNTLGARFAMCWRGRAMTRANVYKISAFQRWSWSASMKAIPMWS